MLISPFSIAPMIDWSHTYFRQFMRILSSDVLIYTEMVTTGAVEHQPEKSLNFHPNEHPIALQLGGSDSKTLSLCAMQAEQLGFDEINLNVGCPSDRVQSGRFGACLMAEPETVANAVAAIKNAVAIPVTVKTRIGIDHSDSYDFFKQFIIHQIDAGVDKIIVHARKAWLNGLSPKENRTIPPINYDFVYRLKQAFPNMPIVINGDIKMFEDIETHLSKVDGVMIGRLACDNPYAIHQIAKRIFPTQRVLSRSEVLNLYIPVITAGFELGKPLSILMKPIINLCHGLSGAKTWKKFIVTMIQEKSISDLYKLERLIVQLEQQMHGKMIQYLVH